MTRSVDRVSFLDSTFPAVPKIIQALEAQNGAMRARELAKLLGVTRQHVYKMAAEGAIPSFRVGASVRFDPALVAEWLRRKMPKPVVAPERPRIAV
jgi:excisionase family DNA binding protein